MELSSHDNSVERGDSSSNFEPLSYSIIEMLRNDPPPDPLPDHWIMHRSRSQTGYVYYYNQLTGRSTWESPVMPKLTTGLTEKLNLLNEAASISATSAKQSNPKPILKKSSVTSAHVTEGGDSSTSTADLSSTNNKRSRGVGGSNKDSKTSSTPPTKKYRHADREPDEVRVLHILKKHKKSRRPSSWRSSKISISKEEAVSDLRELLSILTDSSQDPKELRATFEELAKTESDCSSAKRGGDLGWFGRKKMQPNFEKASFALKVGQLSDIIDTSSGAHIILRLG